MIEQPLFDLSKTAKDLIESNNHVDWSLFKPCQQVWMNTESPLQLDLSNYLARIDGSANPLAWSPGV